MDEQETISTNKVLITVSVMLATVMQILDTTIANVALPHMQGSLSATQEKITWVLTSYIVASAIMTPATGWLSARLGRKRLLLLSIAGFTLASVLCGISSSIGEMVSYRVLQGMFGAALIPLSQAILLDINPPEKHGSAMAIWGVGIMVGPILGPTLGGYLTEHYNWRWVFYINLPVGILSIIGVYLSLSQTTPKSKPFDFFGFLMLSVAIGSIQLFLDRGELRDWFESREIIFYFIIALVSLWLFIIHSIFSKHPFLSPELFRDRNFVTGTIFIFFIGMILLSTIALLPPYMQRIMGYNVFDIGILMAPRGMGTMVAMIIAGRLSGKIDPRILIFLGMSLIAYSLWNMAKFSVFVPQNLIISTGVLQGFGLGLVFPPLSTVTFVTLPSAYRTEAAGIFSLLRNIGSSTGISIVIFLLSRNTQMYHSYLAENVTQSSWRYILDIFSPIFGDDNQESILELLNTEITRQAATIAYLNDFMIMMFIVIVSMPLVFLLKAPKKKISPPKNAA